MSDQTESEKHSAFIKQLVSDAAMRLGEHVDSVRIFVTYPSNNGDNDTHSFTNGAGNIYAQQAQVREWVLIQDQLVRQAVIAEDNEE